MSDYADVLRTVGDHYRIERLYRHDGSGEVIRFSWWKDGKFMPRPLDLPERDFLALLKEAISSGLFSEEFVSDLSCAIKDC